MLRLVQRIAFKFPLSKLHAFLHKQILLQELRSIFEVKSVAGWLVLSKDCLQYSVRKNGSDILVAHQIYCVEEYGAVLRYCSENNIPLHTILDLGANIGISSLYFKSKLPSVHVMAIEAEMENFQCLQNNFMFNGISRESTLHRAVWSSNTTLKLSRNFADGQDWSANVMIDDGRSESYVQTITMDSIFSKFNLESIDLLKIDIEGAEKV